VTRLIREQEYDNESSAIKSFGSFLALRPGDYIAVNNVNFGLFGIGEVRSVYRSSRGRHDTGADDPREHYSHYLEVDWKVTSYTPRRDLLSEGETAWQP
jgi:hypothetical protein